MNSPSSMVNDWTIGSLTMMVMKMAAFGEGLGGDVRDESGWAV